MVLREFLRWKQERREGPEAAVEACETVAEDCGAAVEWRGNRDPTALRPQQTKPSRQPEPSTQLGRGSCGAGHGKLRSKLKGSAMPEAGGPDRDRGGRHAMPGR
jgi:hypothetical protein